MTKLIEDYTMDELSAKIAAIKAERERTANALKRYEEELERRKHEPVLGVPLKGNLNEMPYEVFSKGFLEWFLSEASADKFADYYYNFVEALQDIADGNPIDIEVLKPLLQKGWVAMDENGDWYWYEKKPRIFTSCASWSLFNYRYKILYGFNIKPAENWKESVQECGL